jgi:hypothetical protein
MGNYFIKRLEELRTRYAQTGESKWRYKYDELYRAKEHWQKMMMEEIKK